MISNANEAIIIRKAELQDEGAIEILMSTYYHDIDGVSIDDVLVAVSGNRIVGAVCLEVGKIPEIHSIAVHPDHREKGIGSLLIEDLVSGLDDDFIFTRTTSPVFFEKAGFVRLDDSEKKELWDDCADCNRFNNCKQSVLRLDIRNKIR
ncbi:GNAT family N-acetyltransferase [Methanolobus profundi]|uniref:Amino-acid N-acetyltransferase n=1 Tax=Methanolobus profundi TaxID=487685 RepID=A0A1I4QXE2_9EURY|nr:GNAT family N-acetyltransferase [Methanolobus profundi]SFM44709.1 amino-acid N-acetyltransferase [Methanolobus profundi]